MKPILIALLMTACVAAQPCRAGDRLSIRLVKATNEGKGSASGIEDVTDVLARNLPYKSFSLAASAGLQLPARRSTTSLGDYTVECDGKQSDLSIKVTRDGKQVLRTTAALGDGKPLIVGGFPVTGGKLILVFIAH